MSRCVDAEFQRGAGGLRLNLNPGGAFLAHLTHSTRKGFKQTKTARRRSGRWGRGTLSWQGNSLSSARARERSALTISDVESGDLVSGLVISISASALAANGPT